MDESNRVEKEEEEGTPIEEPIVTSFSFFFIYLFSSALHCTSPKPNASNYVHYQQTWIEKKGGREN
jgi:hypothetical protein